MRASSFRRAHILLLAGALAVPAGAQAAPRSHKARSAKAAPTGVSVDYSVNLAGIPIGNAQLTGAFEGARYRMDVSAVLTGLVGAVTGGQGSARSSGGIAGGNAAAPLPNSFAIATRTSNSGIAVRMALANGNVTQAEITPPLLDTGDRVPVTAAAKRGVIDPASALMMPARARAELTDPDNCNRTLPVFDGATRFNVVLSYGETRQVEKPGYSGPVLVCNARYVAIAGHRPDRPGVKFMEENRDMSVWLAPVEGTRVLVPMRISVRTTLGTNIIEATRWTQTGGPTGTAKGSEAQPTATVADASLTQP